MQTLKPRAFCLLCALAMAYGWAYRGTVGNEPGAMVPGALLGLTLSIGSGRSDWRRRAAIAGLFGSIGWAWGGSLSYMEQTFYVLSGSFPDVLYGYAMLFFLGALWAGIGAGVLALALTEPISVLEGLMRPFTWIAAGLLVCYLCFLFDPSLAESYETLSVRQFHRTVWLAAAIAMIVSAVYWLSRSQEQYAAERSGSGLIFRGAVAWWIGYLIFTRFGGLRLGPLHRSEGWGGLVGMLVVLSLYLKERRNRAALTLCFYGILGGGLAFPLAVFLRHPIVIHWGPFSGNWPQWRFAEFSFGFFMGLAIAIGALRLIRGGLAAPVNDRSPVPLDVYSVFALLIAINWMNFRHHAAPVLARAGAEFEGLPMWVWFSLGGVLASLPLLYVLYRYSKGNREFVPGSAVGKGALLALAIVWITLAGYTLQDPPTAANIAGHMLLWIPAIVTTMMLLHGVSASGSSEPDTLPADPRWRVRPGYYALWGATPVFLLSIAALTIGMQGGPIENVGRKRFGPDAYWRQTANLLGAWRVVGMKRSAQDANVETTNLPLSRLTFAEDRGVTATLSDGATVDTYQWFLKNQYIWLRIRDKAQRRSEQSEVPLEFRGRQFSIAWPRGGGVLIFERAE